MFPEKLTVLQSQRRPETSATRDRSSGSLCRGEESVRRHSPIHAVFPQITFPKLIAFKIVAVHTGRAVPDDYLRAVGDGMDAEWVRSMCRFNRGELDRTHPKSLAASAVEAVEVSLLSLVFRAGDRRRALVQRWGCCCPDRAGMPSSGRFAVAPNGEASLSSSRRRCRRGRGMRASRPPRRERLRRSNRRPSHSPESTSTVFHDSRPAHTRYPGSGCRLCRLAPRKTRCPDVQPTARRRSLSNFLTAS